MRWCASRCVPPTYPHTLWGRGLWCEVTRPNLRCQPTLLSYPLSKLKTARADEVPLLGPSRPSSCNRGVCCVRASAQGATYAADPAVTSVCTNQALKVLMTTGAVGGKGKGKGKGRGKSRAKQTSSSTTFEGANSTAPWRIVGVGANSTTAGVAAPMPHRAALTAAVAARAAAVEVEKG